jgi:hypothetical protein
MFLSILYIQNVSAHPPSKLNLYYNEKSNELFVNITHVVSIDDHYIKSVEIKINGVEFNNFNYYSQPDNSFISYIYNISANDGDVIQVKATCNQFGSLTRELTVGMYNGVSSTPGFTFFLIPFILIFYTILFKKKKSS